MPTNQVTYVLTNISSTSSLFYTIGGSILITLAAIWGYHKIMCLLGFNSVKDTNSEYKP